MHLHHAVHRLAVEFIFVERPDRFGQFGTGEIRRTVQQGRDRATHPASLVAVVGDAVGHQQAAEIGIPQTERAEQVAVLGNVLGRITGVVDQNFLGDEVHPASRLEPLGVERAIRQAELHQIDARQIAGRVVEEHVLRAVVNDHAVGHKVVSDRLGEVVYVFDATRCKRSNMVGHRIGISFHRAIQLGQLFSLGTLGQEANLVFEHHPRLS